MSVWEALGNVAGVSVLALGIRAALNVLAEYVASLVWSSK